MTLTVVAKSTCAYSGKSNQEKKTGAYPSSLDFVSKPVSSLTLDEAAFLKHFQNVDLCSAFYSQVMHSCRIIFQLISC